MHRLLRHWLQSLFTQRSLSVNILLSLQPEQVRDLMSCIMVFLALPFLEAYCHCQSLVIDVDNGGVSRDSGGPLVTEKLQRLPQRMSLLHLDAFTYHRWRKTAPLNTPALGLRMKPPHPLDHASDPPIGGTTLCSARYHEAPFNFFLHANHEDISKKAVALRPIQQNQFLGFQGSIPRGRTMRGFPWAVLYRRLPAYRATQLLLASSSTSVVTHGEMFVGHAAGHVNRREVSATGVRVALNIFPCRPPLRNHARSPATYPRSWLRSAPEKNVFRNQNC